jgi:predicted DNA-binding ribbon-helix-helix protein
VSGLQKKSFTLSGHRTSIALEPLFWEELEKIAKSRGISLSRLVTEVDAENQGNLASILRLHVLSLHRGHR